MSRYKSANGQDDVVYLVPWRLDGTDGTYSTYVDGAQPIEFDSTGTFVAYADLSKETVLGWVQTALGDEKIAEYQATIDEKLSNMATPVIITESPPWFPPPAL